VDRGEGEVHREFAVPATIRDGVLERMGRLGEDTRTLLAAAAVLACPAGLSALGAWDDATRVIDTPKVAQDRRQSH
jgi:hypothetical protein